MAKVETVREARRVCQARGFSVLAHYVSASTEAIYPKMLSYTVLNFRGGVCLGGLNSRADKCKLIDWVNQYLT